MRIFRSAAVLLGCLATLSVLVALRPAPATLEGQILNRASNRPIVGASVALAVEGRRTTSDETGRFTFGTTDVRGPDTLVVSHPDFPTTRLPLGYPDAGTWRLTIHLMPYVITPGDRGSSSTPGEDE